MKIFICEKCGNMVELLQKGTCPVKCCGEPLKELIPNTTDAANEKHVPVFGTCFLIDETGQGRQSEERKQALISRRQGGK